MTLCGRLQGEMAGRTRSKRHWWTGLARVCGDLRMSGGWISRRRDTGLDGERGSVFGVRVSCEELREDMEGTIEMQQGDSRTGFENSAKRRQCRFRDASPTISDRARSPIDAAGWRHHHLLALGCGEENLFPGIRGPSGAIDFFGQRRIKWWKGDDERADGPTRNMTSSQVAYVNFLLPLAGIPGALLSALRSLDSDVRDVVPIRNEELASPLEFE